MNEWNGCLNKLRQGDYTAWPKHEWIRTGRFDTHDQFEPTPTFGLPVWDGSEDSTVLVNADCGMGDTICFYRWMSQIKAKTVLRCDADLSDLFLDQRTCSKDDPIPDDVDSVIHIMAIPQVLGITEITGKKYIEPHGNDFLMPLRLTKFTKVGVCWSGNPFNPRDNERSIPVEKFDFWDDFKPFSLVKHEKSPEFMMDVRHYMEDWLMTSKLISIMHVVISVDTAVAHLAASMGRPTWLLLPEKADWRWGDSGETTSWYDSIKIFRKKTTWEDLLKEVKNDVLNNCPEPEVTYL